MAAKAWKCTDCGHLVVAEEMPAFAWDDGHICTFRENRKYFDFGDLEPVPEMKGTIFYQGKKGDDDGNGVGDLKTDS